MERNNILLDNWPLIRKKLTFRYPQLNEIDMDLNEGQEAIILERIESETGKSREEMITEISTILMEV